MSPEKHPDKLGRRPMLNNGSNTTYHTLAPKEVNQSFHTCAQDVQITHTTNSKVISLQCYNYNNIRVYLLQNDP
jgi:hypothetical protein